MFEERAHPAARLAAWCRVHGTTIVLGAVVGAVMATGGYALLVRSTGPAPAPAVTASAPPVASVATEPRAALRDTIVWRDETGAIFRAGVNPVDFEQLLQARRHALDATRTESRDEASVEILAALKPI